GDELVIAHPGDDLGTAGALVTLGGPALYLVGVVAFGARVGRHEPWTRVAGAVLLLAAVPLAGDAPGLLVTGLATALLIALVIGDRVGVGHPASWDPGP
ncbi:MAG: low temperature requirement protein A, partial [Acidimicrobiales bacterium]